MKCNFIFNFILCLLVVSICTTSAKADVKEDVIDHPYIEVTWEEQYSTYEEYNTGFPQEYPLIDDTKQFLLFLKRDSSFFYVIGGGQGLITVSEGEELDLQALSNIRLSEYNKNLQSKGIVETPTNGFEFSSTTTSITYYIDTTNASSTAISYMNYIKQGATIWNGTCALWIYEHTINDYRYNVRIVFSGLGYSGVMGYTDYYAKREITLYTNTLNSYGASTWKMVTGHEMGHAIGLAHNYYSPSMMGYPFSAQASSPQAADIMTLLQLYPY